MYVWNSLKTTFKRLYIALYSLFHILFNRLFTILFCRDIATFLNTIFYYLILSRHRDILYFVYERFYY